MNGQLTLSDKRTFFTAVAFPEGADLCNLLGLPASSPDVSEAEFDHVEHRFAEMLPHLLVPMVDLAECMARYNCRAMGWDLGKREDMVSFVAAQRLYYAFLASSMLVLIDKGVIDVV